MEKFTVIFDTGTRIQSLSHFEGGRGGINLFCHLEAISQIASTGITALGGRETL